MKLLLAVIAGMFSTQAFATQVQCTLPVGEAVIEQSVVGLTLSSDEKILNEKIVLGKSGKLWTVTSKTVLPDNGLQLKGLITRPGLTCAGSCGTSSFTLIIQGAPSESAPNAKLEIISSRFNEGSGKSEAFKSSTSYNCSVVN